MCPEVGEVDEKRNLMKNTSDYRTITQAFSFGRREFSEQRFTHSGDGFCVSSGLPSRR